MDDYTIFESSYNNFMHSLSSMLQNWEKFQFMVQKCIILGHQVSNKGIEVNSAKIEVISKLPLTNFIKGCVVFWVILDFTTDLLYKKYKN